jgi:uncharacterized membrane-anchored protein YitT (DUF2179 family)
MWSAFLPSSPAASASAPHPLSTAEAALVASRHSPGEDAYAFAIGCSFVALGIYLLRTAGLVTGGTSGMALLASYLVPLPVGVLFTLINLPFFLLASRAMGRAFTLKTMAVNLIITASALAAPALVRLEDLSGWFAALFGGSLIGMGILSLARHGAGVGGIGVVALLLHKRRGWNAGHVQLSCDAVILLASLPVISGHQFVLSVASAAAISGVLIAFHKPGRYTGS